ncbi:hypothetical protein R1sor_024540 [Riccia sorocarpa]|uniref:Uncharacterized protein n=1 Tax=Riccia sorocarpa TaxID=122646 RepID=A0ABD3GT88_9MARC
MIIDILETKPRYVSTTTIINPCSSHSTWPVVLTNYNVPPWLASKKGFLLLALIIPGPKKVKNIDIYLEPLVEELQQLWDGVDDVYDGRTERIGQDRWFTLKDVLLWTMHDYPGYVQFSGFQTSRVFMQSENVVDIWLHDLMIQHLLDPMHIEANVTKSLIKWIFGEKDGKPAKRACEEFGVHPEAWIQMSDGGIESLPPAPWIRPWKSGKYARSVLVKYAFPQALVHAYGRVLRRMVQSDHQL